jgi:hypothetical protein
MTNTQLKVHFGWAEFLFLHLFGTIFWPRPMGRDIQLGDWLILMKMKAMRWVFGGGGGGGGSCDDIIIEKAIRLHLSKITWNTWHKGTCNFVTCMCQGLRKQLPFGLISMCVFWGISLGQRTLGRYGGQAPPNLICSHVPMEIFLFYKMVKEARK